MLLYQIINTQVPKDFHDEIPLEVGAGFTRIHWTCSVGNGNTGVADFHARLDYLLDGVWMPKSEFVAFQGASSEGNVRAIAGSWRIVVDCGRADRVSAMVEAL